MAFQDKNIHEDWRQFFQQIHSQSWFHELTAEVAARRTRSQVYPSDKLVFRAFHNVSPDQVKVVILGQDPYHGEGLAHGLAFSVPYGVKIPLSLHNIFKEIEADLGILPPKHGCLQRWENEGVLLLNAILTVEAGKPGSHAGMGWERFTEHILHFLCGRNQPLVFMLWGNQARTWAKVIPNKKKILLLEASHPSPFSARHGFFGCRHFSKANAFLVSHGIAPVDWRLGD